MKQILPTCALLFIFTVIRAEVVWTEGFETGLPPAGWITNSVEPNTTYAFSGNCSVRLNAAGDYLITPQIRNPQTLIFWTYTTAADPFVVVEYAAEPGGPWTEADESPFSGYTEQWNGQFVDLSSLGEVYIRFRKSGSGTLYLDDVSIETDTAPGHRPPVFASLGDQTACEQQAFSFLVSAADPDDKDPVILSATGLPAGAVFSNGIFIWESAAPAGVYYVTFHATDKDGSTSKTVIITVSAAACENSHIAGYFHGWNGDTVFKLESGQFWQQIAPGSKTVSPALYRPSVTLTNVSGQRRMLVSHTAMYVAVSPLSVKESRLSGTFAGLHNGNIYQLADKTVWRQISFENIPSSATPVTVWRWMKDNRQILRFIDGNDRVIGTCTAEASVPCINTNLNSAIDGYFYGFGYENIFRLADGSWWKQTSFERSSSILRDPKILVWRTNGTDYLEIPSEGAVVVEKLDVRLESMVTHIFTGLHYGNLYRIKDAGDFLQISFEHSSTHLLNPSVMLWAEGPRTNMLIRDSRGAVIGKCAVADMSTDSDRDGIVNADEIVSGTDPLNPQSRFDFRQSGNHVLNWNTAESRIYTIEWAPSPGGPFRILADSITAPQNSWTDTIHSADTTGFYRIRVRLAE